VKHGLAVILISFSFLACLLGGEEGRPRNVPPGGPNGENRPRPGPPPFNREELFSRMDKNGDGVISKEEFMSAPMPPHGPPPPPEEVFKHIDSDGDGKVSVAEFVKAPRPKHRGPNGEEPPAPEDVFQHLDKDHDGSLSVEEFKAGRPRRPPHGEGPQRQPPAPDRGNAAPQPPPYGEEKKDF